MIYTVTLNPSLDYTVELEKFQLGYTNRSDSEEILPGGKGINVSTVLTNLNIGTKALGFVAGFTGDEIRRRLERLGVVTDFIQLSEGFSRINFKLKSQEGTEINGKGPEIGKAQIGMLMEKLSLMQEDDVLVLAGSIPASISNTIYRDIMEQLQDKKVQIVVDATGKLLLNVLELHPVLIKPNLHELEELFQVELTPDESVIPYGKKLQDMGARNVLISMAGHGAALIAEDGAVYIAPAPSGELKNGVGAGDSMVAGFLAGLTEGKGYEHAFRKSVAAGSASAFSENLATAEEIEAVFARVESKKIE